MSAEAPVLKDQAGQTTPLGLLRYGIEYFAAAEAADDAIGDDHGHGIHAPMVVNFLVGQAIELALKAYLLHAGVSADELKRKFGHDIVALFDEAMRRDLGNDQRIGQRERGMLFLLNGPYKARELQYFQAGTKEAFPVYGPLQEAAVVVLRTVMAQIPNGDLLRSRKATSALFRVALND